MIKSHLLSFLYILINVWAMLPFLYCFISYNFDLTMQI
nr:MAG TPA: hypothetical protein [Caudoviricetes sp.]